MLLVQTAIHEGLEGSCLVDLSAHQIKELLLCQPYRAMPCSNKLKLIKQIDYLNSKNIRKVIVDHQDNLWIGTRSGLYKIEKPDSESSIVFRRKYVRVSRIINRIIKFTIRII